MPEEKTNEVPRCGGSFKLGTACGLCKRCEARGYTEDDAKNAAEIERERKSTFPADRIKPTNPAPVIVVQAPVVVEEPVPEPETPEGA